jgi:hypothetical protein
MSHPPADDHGHGAPKPAPKKACHGPHDCYGMPEKKFWRIVFGVSLLTAATVGTAVAMVEGPRLTAEKQSLPAYVATDTE